MAIFKGAGVAMVTPMKDNGEIDYEVLGQLIEDQIAGHTDAIIICGTTGEAPTLEDDEHLEAIRYTVDKTAGRIPVIAGTGSNNTAHAVMMSRGAEAGSGRLSSGRALLQQGDAERPGEALRSDRRRGGHPLYPVQCSLQNGFQHPS